MIEKYDVNLLLNSICNSELEEEDIEHGDQDIFTYDENKEENNITSQEQKPIDSIPLCCRGN